VHVVPIARLAAVSDGFGRANLVVDATVDAPVSLLARAVRVRRRLRACGGDLVVAAGPRTVDVLRRTGLDRCLPTRPNIKAAVGALSGTDVVVPRQHRPMAHVAPRQQKHAA
jgi:hypothetical protein